MRVSLLTRRPRAGANFSVEMIVQTLTRSLRPEFEATVHVSRYMSNGIVRRLYNVLEAAAHQGDVNHVTGDVHFLTFLLRKHKTVLTVLDCGRILGRTDLRSRLVKLLWFTIPVRRCALITVISEAVKRDLVRLEGIDPAMVHVVPVAVPLQFHAAHKEFNAACPNVLQIGTNANKNLPRLFEALAGLRCRLQIVGKLSPELLALLSKHEIDYRNYVGLSNEEMQRRYEECDLVTFASTFEGFGMPIVEANRVGRPVITGNVASMPEV